VRSFRCRACASLPCGTSLPCGIEAAVRAVFVVRHPHCRAAPKVLQKRTAKEALPCTFPGRTAKGAPRQRPGPLPCSFSLPCGVQDLCRDAFLCRPCCLGFAVQSFFAVRHSGVCCAIVLCRALLGIVAV
jgi:hypothetical protein